MRRLWPVLGALAGCVLGFSILQQVTTGAFDGLEARQVAQDADRIQYIEYDWNLNGTPPRR